MMVVRLLDAELTDQPVQRLGLLGQLIGDRSALFGGVRICLNDFGYLLDAVFYRGNHL